MRRSIDEFMIRKFVVKMELCSLFVGEGVQGW